MNTHQRTPEPSTCLRLFDDAESLVVDAALHALKSHNPSDASILRGQVSQIEQLNQLVSDSPSLTLTQELGGKSRDSESLVSHLTHTDGLTGDLDLPIKATLQRTFLLAKIQLFRSFVKALCKLSSEHPEFIQLAKDMREELAQSIYTQMAEDLLLALLRKPSVKMSTKRRAARQLILVWDNATLEIDDFCPFLESAWHARNRVHPGLGCLLGTTEYFRLVAEDCSDRFLDFFSRDGVSEEENQAFAEFLFGLTWEELSTLRQELKAQNIEVADEAWAAKVLGRVIEHDCDECENIDPIALYRSYSRRQVAADYRISSGSPGPKRTAESYLMIYLLDSEDDTPLTVK